MQVLDNPRGKSDETFPQIKLSLETLETDFVFDPD